MKNQIDAYRARLDELEQMKARIEAAERECYTQSVYNLLDRGRVDDLKNRYLRMLVEVRGEAEKLEGLIDGCDDVQLRSLMRMRFFRGFSWLRCAMACGYAGESGARMAVARYLDRCG